MRALTFEGIGLVVACKGQDGAAPAASSNRPGTPIPSSTTPPSSLPIQSPASPDAGGSPLKWDFESDKPGAPPAGFSFARTGQGRDGTWLVRAEPDAPSGANVLAQGDGDSTDHRFPIAVADAPLLRDLDLQVRCKPVSGTVDQACGMVFRYRDANNYYVTRANALEGNVRLYFVKAGQRQQIASFSGRVTSGAWHDYRVVAEGDHFEVYWNGTKVIDHHDRTFGEAGKLGLWTKADSVTYFDNLRVSPL